MWADLLLQKKNITNPTKHRTEEVEIKLVAHKVKYNFLKERVCSIFFYLSYFYPKETVKLLLTPFVLCFKSFSNESSVKTK